MNSSTECRGQWLSSSGRNSRRGGMLTVLYQLALESAATTHNGYNGRQIMDYARQRIRLRLALALTTFLVLSASLFLLHSQSASSVGYAVIVVGAGGSAPVGAALFTYSNASGVL